MAVEITKVKYLSELRQVAEIADEIWHECFVGIISREQIDYMIDKFQSLDSMTDQIEYQGYTYFTVRDDGRLCGYFAVKPEQDDRFFLSKLYLHKSRRGKGFASEMLARVIEEARKAGKKRVYLTVNKHNSHAVDVYRKTGFTIADSAITDIGNGFVMDDYIMEYKL
ncbi:MAG: GNAT family N-acetyltransferase [Ruminococcus flavefaciens]|nr:GNAT family N-acetyltransferase [Ruminococcus flavefaciens]MCM1230454.1 GNAT family N-acetyltransferase [Ruminococcus flavefaciens]